MKTPLSLLLILTVWFLAAAAADAAEINPAHRGRDAADLRLGLGYFKGYVSDAGAVLASPLSWGGSDWLKFSAVAAATIALSSEEDDVQTWVQGSRSEDTDEVSRYVRPVGSGRYVLPALCALYGYGRIAGSDRASRTALLSLESVVVSGVFTGTIKYLTHKRRPGAAGAEDVPWNGPGFSNADLSFPSGHSTCAFAVATIIASEYGDNAIVPPLAYCAAALTAMSRVNDNVHWVPDIIIGSAIGHFTARTIVARHGGGSACGLSVFPRAQAGGVGLAMTYRF